MKIIIDSVSKFLEKIDEIYSKEIFNQDTHKLFFRGIENKKWINSDEPSIFRQYDKDDYDKKHTLINYETQMYNELINRHPESFANCYNTFEHLVTMQHYEYPTRLLDITENPLVALYFACTNKDNTILKNNGRVIIYNIPIEKIKNYQSDTVSLVSNLVKMEKDFTLIPILLKNYLKKILLEVENHIEICEKYNKYIQFKNLTNEDDGFSFTKEEREDLSNNDTEIIEYINDFKNSLDMIKDIFNSTIDCIFDTMDIDLENFTFFGEYNDEYKEINKYQEIKHELNRLKDNILSFDFNNNISYKYFYQHYTKIDSIVDSLDNMSYGRFIHKILEEKNYFDPTKINIDDISSIHCVMPRMNNPRLIAQNGAFLLFGMSHIESKVSLPFGMKIADGLDYYNYYLHQNEKVDSKNAFEFIVPKDKKIYIIKQLSNLNISTATLFPEISQISNQLKDKYISKIKK